MTVSELTKASKEVSSFYVTDNGTDHGTSNFTEYDPYNQLHRATIGKATVKEFTVFPNWEPPFTENGDYFLHMEIVVEV